MATVGYAHQGVSTLSSVRIPVLQHLSFPKSFTRTKGRVTCPLPRQWTGSLRRATGPHRALVPSPSSPSSPSLSSLSITVSTSFQVHVPPSSLSSPSSPLSPPPPFYPLPNSLCVGVRSNRVGTA